MNIKKLFVIGSGFMGSGIGETAATNGLEVAIYDIADAQLEKSLATITRDLNKSVAKGRMTEPEKEATLARITYTKDIADCSDADVIIEAATENKKIKMGIMENIDQNAKPDALVASNTSSISITSLGSVFKDPARFVGLHFFSPVPKMPLLEIVKGYRSSDETLEKAQQFAELMGKSSIVSGDEAGFIVNRMLIPMLNEACFLVERNIGTIEEIDRGVKLGLNHPMGPFELMDMIGIDVELAIMTVLHDEIGDSKYRPAVSLRRMVDSGYLGAKSGVGFYIYNDDGTKEPNPQLSNIR